ncbi:MAG TPA: phosphosulfolactate synthase, partial [Nitrososphaera sp.]|nr:phosphosulfolactate synthase [Nitrososphaera sp.]
KEGRTYIIDKLQGLDKDDFALVAPFVDVVKIYGVIPFLLPEAALEKKVKFYHDNDVRVSTGSTISEYVIAENSFDRFAARAASIGFDIIEIAENIAEFGYEQKKKITDSLLSRGLEFQWKVGRKDPRHQLDAERLLLKVEEGVRLGSDKIVLESNEGLNVGIYDEKGLVKWSMLGTLTSKFPPSTFIFEAPIEFQQSALLAEFGQRVNLAEIRLDAVASVESQRRGFLSKSSFTASYFGRDPEGGPAMKFVFYIIRTKNPIDQAELMQMTHLPRRTVQSAIDELKEQGLIIERTSLDDARKRVYTPVQSEWL